MSSLTKLASLALFLFAAWMAYELLTSLQFTGSGGLGAVSAGVTEAVVELGLLVFAIWAAFFLRSQIRRRRASRR